MQALIAACYIGLTFITYPISFLGLQFRVAELLIFLCFFKPSYIIGLTLGCIIVNFSSAIGIIDVAIGGSATLISCIIIWLLPYVLPSIILITVVNAFSVGFELFFFLKEPFWISVGMVALGEFVVLIVGYVLLLILKKKNKLPTAIKPYGNIDFIW